MSTPDSTPQRPTRVAVYARVSMLEQSTASQLLDLRRYVADRRWTIYREFIDEGISGSRDSRPALNALMGAARKRRFDVVLVWRFDRFARSTKHLISDEFRHLGMDFVSFQENIDTSSPLGEAVFSILAAVGQLERDIIESGSRWASGGPGAADGAWAGLAVAVNRAKLLRLRQEGQSIRQIAAALRVSATTVARNLNGLFLTPSRMAVLAHWKVTTGNGGSGCA